MRLKIMAVMVVGVLAAVPAFAQKAPPRAAGSGATVEAAADGSAVGGGLRTGELTVGTWNWYKLAQTWYYVPGGTPTLYADFTNSADYIYISSASHQASMMNHAAASYHYLGIFWDSSSTWTNARLWYY